MQRYRKWNSHGLHVADGPSRTQSISTPVTESSPESQSMVSSRGPQRCKSASGFQTVGKYKLHHCRHVDSPPFLPAAFEQRN